MSRIPLNPGTVEWSGENSCLYLKQDPAGPFTFMACHFRVVYSPHGPGHALLLLANPQGAHPLNGMYTDNPALATWLRDEFAVHFGPFKDNPVIAQLPPREATGFNRSGDPRSSYSELMSAPGLDLRLTWSAFKPSFYVETPADKSATGCHEMFSLFVPAGSAEISVNGKVVPGAPIPRDFLGTDFTSAFLALSESWIRR